MFGFHGIPLEAGFCIVAYDMELSVVPESANCMHSGGRPEDGMFIVSCGPLEGAGPVYLERCDVVLVDEYLSRFFLLLILKEVPFFYMEGILYSI
jgi:hypothetical protein